MTVFRFTLYSLLLLVTAPAFAAPPNIVMIVADDHGWPDFGFMGSKIVQTPHLDRLAEGAAVFPIGYVPTSLCRASLATLLTGQFGHQHKICCNDPPDGVDRSRMHPFIQAAPALPRLLKDAGYVSLQTGKFWEGHFENAGFTHGMTTKGRHGEEGLKIGRETMKPIEQFLDQRGTKPFFLWYAPMMPHEPHNPPARLLAKYSVEGRNLKLAKYYAMCEWMDETVGTLLQILDQRNLRGETLILFVVDNGWIQETVATKTTRGWFAPKSKMSPYDGGLRTPLIIAWPGHTKAGRYDDLVSTIDVVPTLLSAAAVKVPATLEGLSLLDRAAGNARLNRDAIFGENFLHTSIDLEKPAVNRTHRWVRVGDWKLIRTEDGATGPELYDVSKDPFEEKNLAATEPDRVKQLSRRLEAWLTGK